MDDYLEFLAAGGSTRPDELVKKIGMDITDPAFWDAGLNILAATLFGGESGASAQSIATGRDGTILIGGSTNSHGLPLRDSIWDVLKIPASAVVSGLPLVTKPMLIRLKLLRDAFMALSPGAPFVQFTYSVAPPIPKSLPGVSTEASERIWMNLPPARVWVYRKR